MKSPALFVATLSLRFEGRRPPGRHGTHHWARGLASAFLSPGDLEILVGMLVIIVHVYIIDSRLDLRGAASFSALERWA